MDFTTVPQYTKSRGGAHFSIALMKFRRRGLRQNCSYNWLQNFLLACFVLRKPSSQSDGSPSFNTASCSECIYVYSKNSELGSSHQSELTGGCMHSQCEFLPAQHFVKGSW